MIRDMWEFLADPAQADFERLFFAFYGRALQGDAPVRPLLGEAIESWLDANVALANSTALRSTARVHARLGLAVIRGLLLDLLATGDRAGVDAGARGLRPRVDAVGGKRPAVGGPQAARLITSLRVRALTAEAHPRCPALFDGSRQGWQWHGSRTPSTRRIGDGSQAASGVEGGDPPEERSMGRDGGGHVVVVLNARSWRAGSPKCRSHPCRGAPE